MLLKGLLFVSTTINSTLLPAQPTQHRGMTVSRPQRLKGQPKRKEKKRHVHVSKNPWEKHNPTLRWTAHAKQLAAASMKREDVAATTSTICTIKDKIEKTRMKQGLSVYVQNVLPKPTLMFIH